MAGRFAFLYKLSLNKFYIDELYDACIIRPLLAFSKGLLSVFELGVIDRAVDGTAVGTARMSRRTGAIDDRAVDGAVNLCGTAILAGGEALRRMQTGKLGNYFSVILIGLIVILAFYFVF